MCGIAGIVKVSGQRVDMAAVRAMTEALVHRGPDGEGAWSDSACRVGFGHRRLAIIDLDPRANQPMVSHDRRIAVVFNGEIYNHAALRRNLAGLGCRFQTRSSDTEVLIEGYRVWGLVGLLERIDGIFSFALHDDTSGSTYLVRDRFGIKPLYVAWLNDGEAVPSLLFASELRGIATHPQFRARPAWPQVAQYLTFMSVPAPATILEGVWKVPAGCRLTIKPDGSAHLERYHRAGQSRTPISVTAMQRATLVAEIRRTFAAAVDAQMVADVPIGVMLSGGLDSGAILVEASRRRRELDAYTIAYTDDPSSDETALARETAHMCGARHHVFHLRPEDAIAQVDDVIMAMDEPQADWVCLPLWFLARQVANAGGKVILVGEGADEQFAGYEHWRVYLGRIARLARLARTVRPLASLVAARLASIDTGRIDLLTRADFLIRARRREELFWGGAVLCWPLVRERLWRGPAVTANFGPRWTVPARDDGLVPQADPAACVAAWYRRVDDDRPGADVLARMIGVEFHQRLPELLLMRVDKMTMAHGVEARVPFLARDMVDLSLVIPSSEKLAGHRTKALLREAFADVLPRSVLLAAKRGFGAPVDRWLRGPFGALVQNDIANGPLADGLALGIVERLMREHCSGRFNHAAILWALYVLGRWLAIAIPELKQRSTLEAGWSR